MAEHGLGLGGKIQRPVQVEGPGDGDLNTFLAGSGGGCQGAQDELGVIRAALTDERQSDQALGFYLTTRHGGRPGQALRQTEIGYVQGQLGRAHQLPRCRATDPRLKPPGRDPKPVI